MSMASASARRGIRSRSISASATSCISSPRFSRARPRSCSACASAGPRTIRTLLTRLVRAHQRAADFVEDVNNRDEVAALLAAPNRIGVAPDVIRRTLDGRLKVSPDGAYRNDPRYLLDRPRRRGAARSRAGGVALCADGALGTGAAVARHARLAAKRVCRPDLYDAALGEPAALPPGEPADGIGAFAGPPSIRTISRRISPRGRSSAPLCDACAACCRNPRTGRQSRQIREGTP